MHIMTLGFGFSNMQMMPALLETKPGVCWHFIPNCYETESCVCVGCGGGSVCLLALSTKARWKIAWSYKQQIGNLIKIWCAQTRAYHCFSCVNLGFLGFNLRVFFSFKSAFSWIISWPILVGSMNTSGLWFQNCWFELSHLSVGSLLVLNYKKPTSMDLEYYIHHGNKQKKSHDISNLTLFISI